MRFSVDAHAIGQHLTGNETYVRNLLNGFASLDTTSEFIAYYSVAQAATSLPDRFQKYRVARNPFIRLGIDLTRSLYRDRPHLLHVQYTAPLRCPVPVVVSVHDVSYLERPEFFPRVRAWQLRQTVARTVRKAARVLTVSEFSRRGIQEAYGIDGSNIIVVPNGVSNMFRPLVRENAAAYIRKRFQIPGPYVLTVGDLQPRKNQIGLIDAFESAVRHAGIPHRLVLVGKDTWHGRQVRHRAARSSVADRIYFTGFVSDEDLLQLYGGCDTFVFPSFYEGFGIPILEAMACGRAVACSNTSAMPEVANAAALLFDPHSKEEMTRALVDLTVDSQLRARMERRGQQRSTLFSWERAARQTLAVYYDVAGLNGDSASQQQNSVSVSS
jgi:glycosyltransferase involved in cell wall biosynthesis